jgi:hypothetical protein
VHALFVATLSNDRAQASMSSLALNDSRARAVRFSSRCSVDVSRISTNNEHFADCLVHKAHFLAVFV